MLNKVILIGRLGANPEAKVYEGGKKIAWMNLATERIYKTQGEKKRITSWHKLICYGYLADFVYENLTKGRLLYVEGRLDYWGKEKSPVIIVEDLRILSPKKKTIEPQKEISEEIPEIIEEIPEDIPF